MSEQLEAFGKGGCGCLAAFAVIALLAVLIGGSATINLGGAVILFVIGGVIGLVVLVIYNRGHRNRVDSDRR
jgi:hypothetical protein